MTTLSAVSTILCICCSLVRPVIWKYSELFSSLSPCLAI